ncbi:nuclear membrane fusion protein kar5 [Diplodia corticola]|uniref:Nuclear membrane fusion protein kar5 n=1 Tax=Diplodia corticola TaxID=236234 RepID=A0A1J9S1K6_9PEZI|nr:nuclear membrane fusion protein kar5 [Diplodia corticola]OJD33900.1 nuclear membrane fusion protein kar5 [Diplodia corticola]
MLCRTLFNALAWVLLVSSLFSYAVLGATSSQVEIASLGPLDTRPQDDLSSMLRRAPFHDAHVFEIAWKQIRDIESSPACHQLATSSLIDSCQSFSSLPDQDTTRPAENPLDQVRQEYAAKLAVCELQGIKSGIPRECTPFAPSRQACPRINRKGFFRKKNIPSQDEPKRACYPEFTPHELRQCVDTLFVQAQRWTSFSNAQTNAIVICQASRGAVENEEHLQKLQEAFQSQAKVSEVLSRAVQETEDRLAQHHKFTETVRQFQHDIAARNEAALVQTDSIITKLVDKFDYATGALLDVFGRSLKTATAETQNLSGNIKAANEELEQARTTLQELHKEAVLHDKERSAAQDLAVKGNQALASDVQASLENVRDVTVHALAERLRSIEAAVIHYLNTQQQALEDQQTFQEAQSRIMQNQLNIETSLASHHDIIEEQSHKLAEMTFGGLGNTVATYVGLSFFIILLSRASLILAAAAASGIGAVGMLGSAPSTNLFSIISSTHLVITPWTLRLASYATVIAIPAALIYITIIIGSSFVRNFMISRIDSNTMLEVEVKSDGVLYNV